MGLKEWCWCLTTSPSPTNLHSKPFKIPITRKVAALPNQVSDMAVNINQSRVEVTSGHVTLRAQLNHCVKLCAVDFEKPCLLHFDISYYSGMKWDGLIRSKSETARWDGTTLEGIHSSIHPRRCSKEVSVTSHFIFLNAIWGPTFYFCLSAQIRTQTAYSMIICIKLLICQW